METFNQEAWFQQLHQQQQANIQLSFQLHEREKELQSTLVDYSFVIFPIAKAYEGFLKSYFFSLNLISRQMYEGTRFRIGRALNPDISGNHKDEQWVYDDVSQLCGDHIARQLWTAWLECRNRIFHYYPNKQTHVELPQAYKHLQQLVDAIRAASECKIADDMTIKNRQWQN